MNELLGTLSLWLLDYFVVATLLLAAAALALWRTRQPAQRMALAWGTVAGLTVLAVATALPSWPRFDVRKWAASHSVNESELLLAPAVTMEEQVIPLPGQPQSAEPPALLPAAAADPLPLSFARADAKGTLWPTWPALAWLALAAATLGWISLGAVQAWRLLWTARPSPPWAQTELARLVGKRRKPRLKTSVNIGSAVALGALRPAILLPAEHVREENRAGVQAALAHEWAHIHHGDLWLLAWQRLLLPLLAAHPLFWLLRRQIRADQELLADVAAAGDRPVEYAEALLAWAKQAGPRPSAGLAALAMWENPQTVSRRIQMILDPKLARVCGVSRLSKWLIGLLLIAVITGLSTITFRSTPVVGQEERPRSADSSDSAEDQSDKTPDASPVADPRQKPGKSDPLGISPQFTEKELDATELEIQQIHIGGGEAGAKKLVAAIESLRRPISPEHKLATGVFDAGQVKQLLDQIGEFAQVESSPKLTVEDLREIVVADGNEAGKSEDDSFSGAKVERAVYRSGATIRIQPQVRTIGELSYATKVWTAKQVVRMRVTRERIEVTGTANSDSPGKPAVVSRRATILSDVPIGKTLMIADLSPPIDGDSLCLVLITPTAFHKHILPEFVVPQSIAVPGELHAPDLKSVADPPPADAGQQQDAEQRQIQSAVGKLREEAKRDPKIAELLKENARLQKQISDLTTQLANLRSLASQEPQEKANDGEFIRRAYLDLLGIVPTAEDVRAFLESSDPKKREALLDRLLADPKVADHWSRQWKELIAGRQVPAAEAKSDDSAPPAAAAKDVTVFRLKHLLSEQAVELAKAIFPADADGARIAAEPRSNSVLIRGTPAQVEKLTAIFTAVDKPAAAPASVLPRASEGALTDEIRSGHDVATQRQLLEIDLQEAQSALKVASAELTDAKKVPSSGVSAHEVRKLEAAVRQAELRLRRVKILLDSVDGKEKQAATSPLRTNHEPIVPPKNLPEQIWQRLGLKLEAVQEAEFKKVGSPFTGGLRVTDVREGSPADEQGILKSDILVGLDRWETRTLEHIAFVLANEGVRVSGETSFHIVRDGKVLVGRMPLSRSTAAGPSAAAEPAANGAVDDRATRIRLAEIDLREAQLRLEAASKEHARIAELAKQSSVAQSEVDRIALERQHAELAVERAQVVLEGLKSQSPPAPGPKSR